MKINKASKKRSIILTASLAAMILAVGASIVFWHSQNTEPTNQEVTDANDRTSSVQPDQIEDTGSEPGADLPRKDQSSHLPVDTDSTDSSSSDTTPEKPQISRANHSGNIVKVVALLQEESSGHCELRLSKAGTETITSKSNISVGPSYYACSLEIPREELPTSGSWQATVIHHIGNNTSTSDTVTIEVN